MLKLFQVMAKVCFMLIVLFLCFLINIFLSFGADTVSENQSISADQTFVSLGGNFELGFFRPSNSSMYYIGMWYKKVSDHTIVWVANRQIPISDNQRVGLSV